MISRNLKFLRSQHNLTQKQLAEKLGLKQAAVGAYEEERATPPLSCLQDIATIFQVGLEVFVTQDLSSLPRKDWKGTGKREILAITVDPNGRENVELVSQKASAGYLAGYQDPEFVKDLPKISLPILPKSRTYRAFEIQGDSMLPVLPGSIIFGDYVEHITAVRNNKLYILVTRNDGIVFKRVFNFANEEGRLLLVSDNRNYQPYSISAADVMEVWSARAYFSQQFPDPQQTEAFSADQLARTILTLQQEIANLKK